MMDLETRRRLKRLEALVAGAGGGGSSLARLSRAWFIDGGTTQTGDTGSIAEPFSTVAAFTTAVGLPASAADGNEPIVGYLTPSIHGYTENTVYPAGRSLLLTTDALNLFGTIVGNATWANTTVANAPSEVVLEEKNILRTGSFTVTDDGTAATSIVIFSCDNLAAGAGLSGSFDSHTTQHMAELVLLNATIIGNINCGAGANNASLESVGAAIGGTVTAHSATFIGTQIQSSAITLFTSGVFDDCFFGFGQNCVLTTGTGTANANTFDGPSWRSFVSSGGTRATGVVVVVIGGFFAGAVYGAALPTGAGPTTVSINGTGASVGYTGSNSGNVYASSGLLANSTVQVLNGGGESVGDTVCITKTDLAAFSLTVKNNAGTTIGVIPANDRGSIVLVRAGASAIGGITNDWALATCGALAA